jgi:hypothetical protein
MKTRPRLRVSGTGTPPVNHHTPGFSALKGDSEGLQAPVQKQSGGKEVRVV